MKQFLLLALSLFSVIILFSQQPGQTPGGPGVRMQSTSGTGRIYGKIVDSTGKGVRDASIVLLQKRMDTATKRMKEVLVKGGSTQANGDFNLEGVPTFGSLTLSITAIGYQPVNQSVSFNSGTPAGAKNAQGQMPNMSAIGGAFER